MKRYDVPGKVRIISGTLRGRKIAVPDVPGVRPTTDRVRETLFNWLMPYTQGAKGLDLFAGSGALGFELLSRGGAHVMFIDENPKVIQQLNITAETLGVQTSVTIQRRSLLPKKTEVMLNENMAVNLLSGCGNFDIVFCDPPYDALLANDALSWILTRVPLSPNVLIYIECSRSEALHIPVGVEVFRKLETKTLTSYLLNVKAPC
jgi:16S rRNA (guanine966-N2)-methyltransferase